MANILLTDSWQQVFEGASLITLEEGVKALIAFGESAPVDDADSHTFNEPLVYGGLKKIWMKKDPQVSIDPTSITATGY